jgi:alkyl hydroperoxide reductase subunit AhpC
MYEPGCAQQPEETGNAKPSSGDCSNAYMADDILLIVVSCFRRPRRRNLWRDRTMRNSTMTLKINEIAPDFTQASTQGPLHFYDWAGDSWVLFFSHPKDFTPVCTTELGAVAKLKPEFDKRGVKVLGLSVDPADAHEKWAADIEETQGAAPNFPMIADTDLSVSKLYGMLPADTGATSEGRTPANNATVRNVFIIGPDKQIKLILVYPMTTGRNFDEILRVIDSMQLTSKHKVATPANWKQGQDVIITAAVSNEDAQVQFPGYVTHKPYLRTTKQPG